MEDALFASLTIAVGLIVLLAAYALIPLCIAFLSKTPIAKKLYSTVCVANTALVCLIITAAAYSDEPFFSITLAIACGYAAYRIGVSRLKKKNLLLEKEPKVEKQEKADVPPQDDRSEVPRFASLFRIYRFCQSWAITGACVVFAVYHICHYVLSFQWWLSLIVSPVFTFLCFLPPIAIFYPIITLAVMVVGIVFIPHGLIFWYILIGVTVLHAIRMAFIMVLNLKKPEWGREYDWAIRNDVTLRSPVEEKAPVEEKPPVEYEQLEISVEPHLDDKPKPEPTPEQKVEKSGKTALFVLISAVLVVAALAGGYYWGMQEGYDTGSEAGYDDGYDIGYLDGHSVGYKSGKTAGYNSGFSVGYTAGKASKKVSVTSSSSTPTVTYNPYVCVSTGGYSYHYGWCHYLTDTNRIRLSDAKAYGYTRCSFCNPPA